MRMAGFCDVARNGEMVQNGAKSALFAGVMSRHLTTPMALPPVEIWPSTSQTKLCNFQGAAARVIGCL